MPEKLDYASPTPMESPANVPALLSSSCAVLAIIVQGLLCGGIANTQRVWLWSAIAGASMLAIAFGAWGELRGRRSGIGRDLASFGLIVGLILGALSAFFVHWHGMGYDRLG